MFTSDEITLAIEERLGFVPPFFTPASETPQLLGHLWQQMLTAHLDNPLPELFKEKLLASVGRYCTVPYHIVCHSCALAALGVPAAQVLALLERPVPSEAEIERDLAAMAEEPAPLAAFPPDGSPLSEALLRTALHFFLNRDRAARCRAALRRLLGDTGYNHLMALLAHAKTSHVWAESHPELSHEQDRRAQEQLPALLAAEPRLGEVFRTYRDRARREYRRLEEQLVADIDRHRQAEEELRRRVTQLQTIYQLNDAVSRAEAVEEIYREALEGLGQSLNVDRAAILIFDPDGVMRFKSWRGLSERYRQAVEGHSPWPSTACDPEPVLVPDVARDAALADYLPMLRAEGIRALAFVPLCHGRRLLGKFMLYYDQPHGFTAEEVRLAQNVAGPVGFAIARRQADEERERLLQREQAARAQAEEASRAKDDFLATISHELRTPLTAILAWPVILRSKGFDPQAAARGLEVIERNAKLQAQIIDDLLEVSRIVTGKLRLDLRPLELTPLLESAVETVRSTAEAKGVRLRTVLDEPAGPVLGDPDRLHQVLWNLASNAVKFTPAGGTVQVRLWRTATSAEITVSDDGIGISPEFLPYVFERFRQADSSTSRQHGGLGLGLAIVRHLVEMHGGTVRADSRGSGQGATFTVSLPLCHPAAKPAVAAVAGTSAAPAAAAAPDRAALAGLRVLVVDDEPDTLEMLDLVLSGYGAEVRTADGCTAALDHLTAAAADVLVSDIGMPGEDGFALIRRVRSLGPAQGGRIPAVALTAYARSEDRIRALAAGFQAHVTKPVDPPHLAEVIATVARVV